MDFKKDLGTLAFICSTGSGRLVSIESHITAGADEWTKQPLDLFLASWVGINAKIFRDKLVKDFLKSISSKFIALQEKTNKELAKEWKELNEVMSESFYQELIDTALKSDPYNYKEFDRFEDNFIAPDGKFIGITPDFHKKMKSLFDESFQYYFTDSYIVWRSTLNGEILFVIKWVEMTRQLSLTIWDEKK